MFPYLFAQSLIICLVYPFCKGDIAVGCQHKLTSGKDYNGKANVTSSGVPCKTWSDKQPFEHPFTSVGDHNYCRNPVGLGLGASFDQVWCITNIGLQNCSVPFCPPLKVLDFSLDGDSLLDNGNLTHASLQKENFPSSFTICTAFMVEQWGRGSNSPLFLLIDDNNRNNTWLYVELSAALSYTAFTVRFSGVGFTVQTPSLFFPMQWTRVCFSFNSNTSIAALVVDGSQLLEKTIVEESKPSTLNMRLGVNRGFFESPGRFTNLNIFPYKN